MLYGEIHLYHPNFVFTPTSIYPVYLVIQKQLSLNKFLTLFIVLIWTFSQKRDDP